MPENKPHIIIIDGEDGSGRKTLCFELSLILLYNNQKTALLLKPDSKLKKMIEARRQKHPELPSPSILSREEFSQKSGEFNAILIPESNLNDNLAEDASTYITVLKHNKNTAKQFQNNLSYINSIWELKKKIASLHNHSLDWVVCQNNLYPTARMETYEELKQKSRLFGYRTPPPLNFRFPYQNTITGISAQDRTSPTLEKTLTYEDICAKREITKLAEFIFS